MRVLGDGLVGILRNLALNEAIRRFDGKLETIEAEREG
jgi:hypothetical protein